MSTQPLTPFKAYFELNVQSELKEIFNNPEEVSFEERLSKFSDNIGNIDIEKLVKHFHLRFNFNELYKPLYFNYQKITDVNPSNMTISNKNFKLSFTIRSYDVEVIQIDGDKITFVGSGDEVKNIMLDKDIKLIKAR